MTAEAAKTSLELAGDAKMQYAVEGKVSASLVAKTAGAVAMAGVAALSGVSLMKDVRSLSKAAEVSFSTRIQKNAEIDAGQSVSKASNGVSQGASGVSVTSGEIAPASIRKMSDGPMVTAGKGGSYSIPTEKQMHDAVTEWARMEESLANSNRQLNKFNTASVAYDGATGNYYYGMNRGVQVSGDSLNSSLKSWLPERSLNQYRLGNCAEVDAVNQALNGGADINNLYLYTINTKNNLPKAMCENCVYTFINRVADVLSN